jgi:DNA-binding transcriptional regulator GbsR (MarR family)
MQRQGATDEAREAFVRLWERMAGFWGVTPGAARVHAWLVSREAGADAEELMEGLAMSRGAVSMACRELAEWGLARAEREPGSRRQLWRTETDLEKVVRTIVQTRKRREWDPILEHLREWIPRLEEQRSAEAAVFRARLEAIESIVALADSMAESFLGGGIVQRLGLRALTGAAQRSGAKARKGRKNT